MPGISKDRQSEWDRICNGEPLVTVGFFDEDGNVIETSVIDVRDVDSLDEIASDMDIKNFYNAVLNC